MKQLLLLVLATLLSGYALSGDTQEEQKFNSLDMNRDHYISRDEAGNSNLWEHFPAIDVDRDNQISPDEFSAYLAQNPQVMDQGEAETEQAE